MVTIAAHTQLGPYEIDSLIGTGGMGEVYRAQDPRLSRAVAVKLITAEGASSPERLRRFETEARAAAQLVHPNVVTVFDVGIHDGHPYLVLELLEGQTLRETLKGGIPPLRQALSWMLEAAHGLGAAHERGIVHRDFKPENAFLTKDGRVKVLDFGLAKLQEPLVSGNSDTSSPTATKDTSPGVLLGTIGYMSPEQVKGEPAGARTDVFALGAVLYELLSGRRAFGGATTAEVLASILRDEPPSLMALKTEIPASVETVVRRCLGKHPSERFSSGGEVAVALETVLSSFEPSRATGARPTEPRGPYPGLSSFTEADAERFFGREAEVGSLWEKLRRRKLLALIGPSGAGKTSFVRAGILASRPTGWGAVVATPGAAPMRALAQALIGALPSDPDTLRDLLAFDDAEVAFRVLQKWRKGHLECLLVLDQFEELFTLNPPEVQAAFSELLGRLAGEGDVHVLLSLRDDFLIRCHDLAPLAPVFQNLTPLTSLAGEDLRRALVEPAKKEGYAFEDDALIDEMLQSVAGARGALPLLAFAVARLWEKRDRENKLLTRQAYEQIGGVAGALAQHAEQTLERIGFEREPIVRELFRNLVTAQWTRAVAERQQLVSVVPDHEAAGQVLDELISARLLASYESREPEVSSRGAQAGTGSLPSSRGTQPESGDEGATVPSRPTHRIEIVHESLIRAWPRLVRWQAQDEEGAVLRDQLKQAAHLWEEKGRSPDVLWTGSAFQEFELWRGRYQGKLTALEDEYAQAMLDRVRRHRRIRKMAIAAFMVTSLAVAVIVGVSRQQAVREAKRADEAARRAEASKLVALAGLRLEEDPTEALALATASLELADTEEVRVFVMRVLWQAPPAMELPGGDIAPRAPSFSLDGTRLVATGHTRQAAVWREDGSGPIRLTGELDTDPRCSNEAGWSRSGLLVTGPGCGFGSRVKVWDLPAARSLRTIDFGAPSSWVVGDSHLLVATPRTDQEAPTKRLLLRSWLLPDGEVQTLGEVSPGALGVTEPRQHGFEPGGRGWVYARGRDVYLKPLPVQDGVHDRLLARHPQDASVKTLDTPNTGLSFSRDRSGEIRRWSFAEGRDPLTDVIPRPATAPAEIVPVPGGRWVARSIWEANDARLWDLEALPGARPLVLRRSGSWYGAGAAFHPEGTWIVVSTHGTEDLTFWPLTRTYPSVVEGYTSAFTRPVAFSADSRWLATAWPMDGAPGDMALRLWPVPGSGERDVRELHVSDPTLWINLVFDPRGRYLFAVGNKDHAWIVPLDGSPARRLPSFSDGTLLQAAAVSPSGRLVATAFYYGKGAKTLRVWDVEAENLRVFDLPPSAMPVTNGVGSAPSKTGFEQGVHSMHFLDESTLFTAGDGGLRRWDLGTGSCETVLEPSPEAGYGSFMKMAADTGARVALVRTLEAPESATLLVDLDTGATRPIPEAGHEDRMVLSGSGALVALGSTSGVVRVGRIGAGPPHILVGHDQPATHVAVSPDLKWVASAGQDHTLRLWPMPDLDKPPLHTLPHDELLAKLKSLTNLRAVRDPESATGWTIDVGPFLGWKEVPEW